MDRKKFLKQTISGFLGFPLFIGSCNSSADNKSNQSNGCTASPSEMAGPFPIKKPSDLIRENIIGDRNGVPLKINITVQDVNKGCKVIQNAYVDIWQCDSKGNYSEYNDQLDGNFTGKHFLRGRQKTDSLGKASFTSIYPGWYPGRAPHIHLEVLTEEKKSLLITQIAFPDAISRLVYQASSYKGLYDTGNDNDFLFRDSLAGNMADSVTGNVKDGYTLNKVIRV